MDPLMRFSYAIGRAIGAAAGEFVSTMWPAQNRNVNDGSQPMNPQWQVSTGTFRIQDGNVVGTPDDLDESGTYPDEPDWSEWAPPIIAECLPDVQGTDIIARMIADKLAHDPARAIAALWEYELRQDSNDNG
jgi:hypothetical protein